MEKEKEIEIELSKEITSLVEIAKSLLITIKTPKGKSHNLIKVKSSIRNIPISSYTDNAFSEIEKRNKMKKLKAFCSYCGEHLKERIVRCSSCGCDTK